MAKYRMITITGEPTDIIGEAYQADKEVYKPEVFKNAFEPVDE